MVLGGTAWAGQVSAEQTTLARIHSVALAGVQGQVAEIVADIENALVALLLAGVPDTALRQVRGPDPFGDPERRRTMAMPRNLLAQRPSSGAGRLIRGMRRGQTG